ncbi:MAG: 2-C-methyl-D-erythritol 4-phosphate cytidylyltransferase [Chloroflexi bacterium]|nr:2-C-methyl-D-erythritol 4-phosphate cytidylyltransferase [Chloroflexota bacterium]
MSGIDKVFAPLGGHPVVYWPLLAAQKSDLISAVVLVLSPQNIDRGRDLAYGSRFDKVMEVCLGGATRQESVHIGLSKLPECEWVIIHDAARPFLDGTLIEDGLRAAEETGAAIAAVPVKDTIKVAGLDGLIVQTPRRDGLWAAQTPQIFRFDIISEAYKSSDEATDDASLVERAGGQVKLYAGSYENIKITTPEDLAYAELLLKKRAPCA